ncbi:unnamed protein product [Lota lota]
MNSDNKPNFLSQPVVKNIFMYRNGDPYYDARRIVINEKRVCNFETLLREVTGGVQAPFGAVRNIYTPRGGHKVECLDHLQSGEQYVAAGKEKFKKLDYTHIGSRKKKMQMSQNLPLSAKFLPQRRLMVAARFLNPIRDPCPIFVVANGDLLNPVIRLLIQQRMQCPLEKILEMITEKMGLRVLGGVRSLYTFEGQQVTEGSQLESGQFYVAVGRERFKRLPYSDLIFSKPRGTRRVNGSKSYSLPPIYRFTKQNGNGKSSGGGDSKASPPGHSSDSNKDHISSMVREISQARLMSLRRRKSGLSMTLSVANNADSREKTPSPAENAKSDEEEDNGTNEGKAHQEVVAENGGEEVEAEAEAEERNEEEDEEKEEEVKEKEEGADATDKASGDLTNDVQETREEKGVGGGGGGEGENDVKAEEETGARPDSSSSNSKSNSVSNSNQEEDETKTDEGATEGSRGENKEESEDKAEGEEGDPASSTDAKENGETDEGEKEEEREEEEVEEEKIDTPTDGEGKGGEEASQSKQ